jgi:hypothetical protein
VNWKLTTRAHVAVVVAIVVVATVRVAPGLLQRPAASPAASRFV